MLPRYKVFKRAANVFPSSGPRFPNPINMLRMERVEVGIILRKGVGLYHPERLTGLGGGGARATQPGAGRPAFPWVATTDPVTAATVRDPDRCGRGGSPA